MNSLTIRNAIFIKMWALTSALVLLLASASSQNSFSDDFEKDLSQVFKAYEAGAVVNPNEALEKLSSTEGGLKIYGDFFLGQFHYQNKQWDQARFFLKSSLLEKPTQKIRDQARWFLAQIEMTQGQWKEAKTYLRKLERTWRRSPKYPQVLLDLIHIDRVQKRSWQVCRRARKLYTKYSDHPVLSEWNLDLMSAEVRGERLGCEATVSDQKKRIRRLQWAGQVQRARKEISDFYSEPKDLASKEVLVRFLLNEGYVDQGVQLTLAENETPKNRELFFNLLARGGSKAGDPDLAIGSYLELFNHQGLGSKAKEALYYGAFTAYQLQDYDLARDLFRKYDLKFPRSRRARDARWHVAWMDYLRGDYLASASAFDGLKTIKKRRRRRTIREDDLRSRYWLAMSLLRGEKPARARIHFEYIIKKEPFHFYAHAARSRMNMSFKVGAGDLRGPAQSLSELPPEASVDEMANVETNEDRTQGVDDLERVGSESILRKKVKNPRLVRYEALKKWNLIEDAKDELYEIERKERGSRVLLDLIPKYEAIRAFHRSSYISETKFRKKRFELGFAGAEELWQSTFPKAYEKAVTSHALHHEIPAEWIWSIMRAESRYRFDARSPVGARGLLQIMPGTAERLAELSDRDDYELDRLTEPEMNISLGATYLKRLGSQFGMELPLVAAAYNAGPHRVQSWLVHFGHLDIDEFIEHIPFRETRNYSKKVTKYFATYLALYQRNLKPLAWLSDPIQSSTIDRKLATRENWQP